MDEKKNRPAWAAYTITKETEAQNLNAGSGVQFPRSSLQDGLNHSIFDTGSSVNSMMVLVDILCVEVSNIGYTQAAREQSREGWRFAKQIRPDLDCGKTSDNCVWLSGTLGRIALFTT